MKAAYSNHVFVPRAVLLSWRRIVFGCLVFLSFLAKSGEVFADTFSSEEIHSLTQTANDFEKTISANDYVQLAHGIPPKIWNFVLDKNKMTDAQLVEQIHSTMQRASGTVTISLFKIDVEHATATQLSDGFRYMLIPTDTYLTIVGTGKVIVHAQTLAFIDCGKWYLVRISEPQQSAILKIVYPSFKDVEFSKSTTENVKE